MQAKERTTMPLKDTNGSRKRRFQVVPSFNTIGKIHCLAVYSVMLVLRTPQSVAPTADAFELLTDDVDPEFYQDLDLYQWLADSGADNA